jgi:capsular polysaccharide transport system permease protein
VKFLDGLTAQSEVIFALALRETRTRFGKHKLGYLWALVEPALLILTFYIAFWLAGRGAPAGMTLWSFTATGIIPYLIFASTTGQVAEAINGNKSLLFYPQVNPIDVVLARIFLELVTYVAALMVLLGIEALYLQELTVDDPLLLIGGLVFAALLGGGFGMIFCGLGQLSNVSDRVRSAMMRPFFWISGLFFTAAGLPPAVRELMLYNPVLHVVELTRAGLFTRYDDTYASPSYVVSYGLVMLLAGLTLMRAVRRRIEVS